MNMRKLNRHLKQYKNKSNSSGADERPLDIIQSLENVTNIAEIIEVFKKNKLLKTLEDNNITNEQKIDILFLSRFVDELNPNVIKAPNLTKGLKW